MKKLKAVPVKSVSSFSGKEYVDQAIIYDDTWIVAAVHIDAFFDKETKDNPEDPYNRLRRGETVEFTITPC